jgi:hypothetical protein
MIPEETRSWRTDAGVGMGFSANSSSVSVAADTGSGDVEDCALLLPLPFKSSNLLSGSASTGVDFSVVGDATSVGGMLS